jgi:hypothetical protein
MVLPLVLLGAGMGLMMMALNTHMLNSAPRELTSRVTALSQALQNVVSSLAIATFATVLQARMPVRISEATQAAGGQATPQLVADASAAAFGDVYVVAMVVVAVAWALGWTLRRGHVAAGAGPPQGGRPAPSAPTVESEREPVAAGHF